MFEHFQLSCLEICVSRFSSYQTNGNGVQIVRVQQMIANLIPRDTHENPGSMVCACNSRVNEILSLSYFVCLFLIYLKSNQKLAFFKIVHIFTFAKVFAKGTI